MAHPPELRAQVLAAIAAGASIREAARQFALDPAMVSRWVATGLASVATEKTESDGELIMRFFRTTLRAMTSQAEVFGDPDYCRRHDPDKLAISFGVMGDKLAGVAATAAALGLIDQADGQPALASPVDVVEQPDVVATAAPDAAE